MRQLRLLFVCFAALTVAPPPVVAAPPSKPAALFTRIAAPAQPRGAIALGGAPASTSEGDQREEVWDRMPDGQPILRNVTRATITPFLPPPSNRTGAAMIVVPGGGFGILAMRNEGWAIAQWLADHGVTAFVLKYRIKRTPADEQAMLMEFASSISTLMNGPEKDRLPPYAPATTDAMEAIRHVRANARLWDLDPERIGMIGFSAGALTTLQVTLSEDAGARPNFIGYIYGPMTPVTVPANAPPMFAALAMDDPLFGVEGFGIVESWRRAKRPVELHVYEKGGHGFGVGAEGTTAALMLPELDAWLQARGLLKQKNWSGGRR